MRLMMMMQLDNKSMYSNVVAVVDSNVVMIMAVVVAVAIVVAAVAVVAIADDDWIAIDD